MEEIKEKSADEMFEELGYEKIRENQIEIIYLQSEEHLGEKFNFEIIIARLPKLIYSKEKFTNRTVGFNLKILKAINKKIEELRMVSCKSVKKTLKKVAKM